MAHLSPVDIPHRTSSSHGAGEGHSLLGVQTRPTVGRGSPPRQPTQAPRMYPVEPSPSSSRSPASIGSSSGPITSPTSPAAQWLNTINASTGSNGASDGLMQHLQRSASSRSTPRRTHPAQTLSMISLGHSRTPSAPAPRRGQEGFEFGPPARRFRLGRAIGFGDMSVVHVAEELSQEQRRLVAAKVVRTCTFAHTPPPHELRVWRSLPTHPHLLALLYHERTSDVSAVAGVPDRVLDLLVMEFSEAGSLLQYVRNEGSFRHDSNQTSGPSRLASGTTHRAASATMHRSRGIPLGDARVIFQQLADGLACLHKMAGFVHADLKLENVLAFPWDERQGPMPSHALPLCWKIADFGLAHPAQYDGEAAGGTLAYAAPEVVRIAAFDVEVPSAPGIIHGRGAATDMPPTMPFARDMWALGCMLYALTAGHLPFLDPVSARLQQQILQGEYEIPARLLSGTESQCTHRKDMEQGSKVVEPLDGDPLGPVSEDERRQAREVLAGLLETDLYLRWTIDDLCQSAWLA